MRGPINLRTRFFLIFFIGYLVFLPTGPYPLFVAGLRVEYVLFALVSAVSLTLMGRVHQKLTGNYGSAMLFILIYIMVIGLTTLLSSQPDISDRAFWTAGGYAYLTCVTPPLIYRHMNVIRHALLWLSGITGAFLMYLYISQGYGTTQRFALADVAARSESDANYVDPNMTAIGLMMCVIVAIPVLLNTGSQGVRRNVNRLTAVAVIGCALFFESRTSALSLIIGVAFGIMRAGSGMGRGRKALKRAAVIGAMLLVAGLLNRSGMQAIVDRMQNVQLDTTTASGRISLFEDAFRDWSSSNKSVILGNGYYVSNPHNELIRSLDCDGIIGLTAFVTLMMGVYMVCCRGPQYSAEQILSQNVLFAYIVSAMMTYGHTKTMWLAYLFLLAGYLEAEARGLRFRKGAAVRVGQFGVPGRLKAVSQGS